MRILINIIILLLVILPRTISAQTYLEKKEFQKIKAYYKQKNYKEVYKRSKTYISKYPSGYYAADVYFYLGKLERSYYAAILIYQDLIDRFPEYEKTDEAIYRLGKLYFLHNNTSEAIRTFEKLLEKYPKSNYYYGTHYYLGVVYLIKNDRDNTLRYFDYIIKQNKKEQFHVLAVIGKPNLYYENRDYSKAVFYYKQALTFNRINQMPAVYLGLGNSYMKQKVYDKAYYYYKLILNKYAGSSEYEVALGKVKYMNENKSILDQINFEKLNLDRPKQAQSRDEEKEYYTVQVASVKSQRYANDWRIKLKTQGFDAFYKKVDTDKGVFYRTCVGKFMNKGDADAEKKKIEEKFKLDCLVIKLGVRHSTSY